ncbi:MAG: tRNA dimethylallyltransferase [Microgenomates group bacterium GW2011_GWA2_46_7]|nr:MAG: tRNA dimethylallyltransferase [Microgenomates group bacterium GW2011_GWA2_46_7]
MVPAGGNLTPPPPSVNILSADSRQVYKDLDIVTGKDMPTDLSPNIKFFGLDLVDPDKIFNLSDFKDYAQKVINDSVKQDISLIIVGGTGLYLKAITSDLLNVHVPANPSLRQELEKLDLPSLQSRLLALNPQKYESLNHSDLHNPRRLIRAIEIASSPPIAPALSREGTGEGFMSPPTFQWIGLKQDKEVQKTKIHQRVLDRLDSGAIEEVENLMKKYPDYNLPIFTSLGVKEIVQYLKKDVSRDELIDHWTLSESDYARRQMVWFKKQPGIVWYDKDKVNMVLIKSLSSKIQKCSRRNT